jgi:hypothetical protein
MEARRVSSVSGRIVHLQLALAAEASGDLDPGRGLSAPTAGRCVEPKPWQPLRLAEPLLKHLGRTKRRNGVLAG